MNKHDTNEIKLNDNLLFDQGVKPKAEDAIKTIHNVLRDVLSNPESYGKPSNVVSLVEHLEYTLQSLWNFTLDSKFHRYWFEVDGCLCSKLDNKERVGSGYFVYNMQCPFHSVILGQRGKECNLMENMVV